MSKPSISVDITSNATQAQAVFNGVAKSAEQTAQRMETAFKSSAGSIAAILTGGAFAAGFTAIARATLDAGLAAERMSLQFKAASGGVLEGVRNIAAVKKMVNDLGLEFQSTAESYARFMAATRGTALEGLPAEKIFRSVSMMSSALQLTADSAGRAFLQLQQMASKGKVTAEDLNILAEALPGIKQIIIDSLGTTGPAFAKMMADGRALTNDILPGMAYQLEKTFGEAAQEGAKSSSAAMNRFHNAIFEARQELAYHFIPLMTEMAESGTRAIKGIIPLEAELVRLAMLTDKAGGSLTRLGATLSYPGAISGSRYAGEINKWFVEQNKLYESRYNDGDRALQDLADREVGVGEYAPIAAKNKKELAAERARNAARAAAERTAAARAAAKSRSGGGRVRAAGLDYIDAGPMTSLKTIQERMDIDKYALEQWIELGQLPNGFLQVPERTKGKTSLMGGFGGFQSLEQQADLQAKRELADQSIAQLQEQLQTEEERMRASYEARLKMVKEYASQYGMAEEKRSELVNKIQAQQIEYEKQQQIANFTSTLGIVEGQISQFTGLLDQRSKSQFYAWKAFAIAQATISTALAVANILAAESKLGVAAIPLAFGAGAIGAAQIGVIANTEYVAQRELGGPVTSATPYIVGEAGPELFVPAVSGSIIPNNKLGGGGVEVTVVNQFSLGIQDTVRAEMMGMIPTFRKTAVDAVYQAIESGGPIARAVGRG